MATIAHSVVKKTMGACVKLKPKSPVVYKLRADWTMKFGDLADEDAASADYEKAISLLEASTPEKHHIPLHDLPYEGQHSFLLASCHYHLAGILYRK
eukprot:gene8320-1595_t